MSAPASGRIHPAAIVESEDIGPGTNVWAFAHVMAGARVGASCNIGEHCFVEAGVSIGDGVTIKNGVQVWDGVALGDGVFVGPGVVFTNDRMPRSPRLPEAADRYRERERWLATTTIERGATLGAGAIVVAGVVIGEFAFVAAGALVTRDVDPHALVLGSPARRIGWVCRCGGRLADDTLSCECGRRYRSVASTPNGISRLEPVGPAAS